MSDTSKNISVKWTEPQRMAIEIVDRSLLISAAAGSGKTAVLAERCAHLICDVDPPVDVDRLLVVTFTDAAATEMRQRIQRAVRRRRDLKDTPRLARQAALLDHANISTLHGFCSRLLRKHFQLLGLDPDFTILDGDEAMLLRGEIARDIFARRYDSDSASVFQNFIDAYGNGDDERLISRVIKTHEMLASVVDPAGWRAAARSRIASGIDQPLEASPLGQELIRLVRRKLAWLRDQTERAGKEIKSIGGFDAYVDILREHWMMLKSWEKTLADHGLAALSEEHRLLELDKLPSFKATVPNKDLAKSLIDAVREELGKKGQLYQLLRFTADQWQEGLARIQPHAGIFLDLIEEFGDRYTEAKRAQRVVDFSDLERLTLQVLCEAATAPAVSPSALARSYHDTFSHVLVDEYQDINEVQDAILKLISRESRAGEAGIVTNLFCVGDVKQSIYRFRLADSSIFLDRQTRFGPSQKSAAGKLISLPHNFRSREPLLESINALFKRLMTPDAAEFAYDTSHELRAGQTFPTADGTSHFVGSPIELHLLPKEIDTTAIDSDDAEDLERSEREAKFVAAKIRGIMGLDGSPRMQIADRDPDDGSLRYRPVRFGDIVILLRTMRHKADDFAGILRATGVPVHSESGTGYFQSLEIRDMLSLLQLLDNQRQDIPMAAVLRSPIGALPEPEDSLARIRMAYRGREIPVPFHQAVVLYAQEKSDELAARLRDILHRIDHWRELAHQRPLAEVIWTIYEQTGYLAFCAGLPDGPQRTANLLDLHERAQQFGTFRRQGIGRFMKFLKNLEDESDLGQPSVASAADDVVRVMSIHRSKGLEFPIVIVPDLGKAINFDDCRGMILADRQALLGLHVVDETLGVHYPSLASVLVEDRLHRAAVAEELRVLYVATTRAKEHLILVGTCDPKSIERWRSRWANHKDALPADVVLAATSPLDWLGPVAASTAGEKFGVQLIAHDEEEVAAWMKSDPAIKRSDDFFESLAALAPLPGPAMPDAGADRIIARLAAGYAHQPFTQLPAATSVGEWTKHGKSAPLGYELLDRDRSTTFESTLPTPRFLQVEGKPLATDTGQATHLALQYLDFSDACDDAGIDAQLRRMIDRRFVSLQQAKLVDRAALVWVAGSEVGQLLREHAKTLRRELAVTYSTSPAEFDPRADSADPLDRVMVRGRIDVLVPHADGLTLIDYKTDRVTEATLHERAEFYRPQMLAYATAIEAISRQKVAASLLVFLTPRQIVRV